MAPRQSLEDRQNTLDEAVRKQDYRDRQKLAEAEQALLTQISDPEGMRLSEPEIDALPEPIRALQIQRDLCRSLSIPFLVNQKESAHERSERISQACEKEEGMTMTEVIERHRRKHESFEHSKPKPIQPDDESPLPPPLEFSFDQEGEQVRRDIAVRNLLKGGS